MWSDNIARQMTMIVNATKQNQIQWKPLGIYLKCDGSNQSLNQYLKSIIEYKKLNENKSFYCRRDEKYLVLIDYIDTLSKVLRKNKEENKIEIFGIAYKGAEIIQIPAYFEQDYTIKDFQKSIQQYWDTKVEGYSLEFSDMMDTLETFSSLAIGNGIFGEFIEED